MIQVIIIDDQAESRNSLKNLLSLCCTNVSVIGEADNIKTGYSLISNLKPELVFLDVQMPGGSGFDLLEMFSNINFKIIFTTAHDQFAVKAFKYSAFDYLLKPIDAQELKSTIEKYSSSIKNDNDNVSIQTLIENLRTDIANPKKIVLSTQDKIHVVKINDIVYCEASINYTLFYLIDKNKILVTKTLKEYEELLEEHQFIRIHKTYLANFKHIVNYEKAEGGFVNMINGSHLPVSYRKKEKLVEMLQKV